MLFSVRPATLRSNPAIFIAVCTVTVFFFLTWQLGYTEGISVLPGDDFKSEDTSSPEHSTLPENSIPPENNTPPENDIPPENITPSETIQPTTSNAESFLPINATPTLASEAPNSTSTFPEVIWYKLGPKGLNDQGQAWIDSCINKNPTFRAELLTDETGEAFVKRKYIARPDIVDTYLALPYPILKADFLRYLLLYSEGGIWNDLDVTCEDTPIHEWVPEQYRDKANLVLGWEFDVGWGGNFFHQFATWTVMTKPQSPHLGRVIDNLVHDFADKSKAYNVSISELTMDMIGDVVDATGPRRMTIGIMESLKQSLNGTLDEESMKGLMEPKLFGDVLVLPGYAFAASSNTYEKDMPSALVTHHYAGSWKNDKFGE